MMCTEQIIDAAIVGSSYFNHLNKILEKNLCLDFVYTVEKSFFRILLKICAWKLAVFQNAITSTCLKTLQLCVFKSLIATKMVFITGSLKHII